MKKLLFILSVVSFVVFSAKAQEPQAPTQDDIQQVFQAMDENFFDQTREMRILDLSAFFLGVEYGTVHGEGEQGKYQQGPYTCFAYMDCVTYVEAVLALGMIASTDEESMYQEIFEENLLSIKYNGRPTYKNRNHFASIDWLPHQQENELLSDISEEYEEYVELREKRISKKDWYLDKKKEEIKCEDLTDEEVEQCLEDLRSEGTEYEVDDARLYYFPTSALISDNAKLLYEIFEDTDSSILLINTVRNEHVKKDIPVIISHQGFLIRRENQIVFRNASSVKGEVVDQDFVEYAKKSQTWKSWPVLGFNLQKIL